MKIKLDENLPTELVNLLKSYRHDVQTVPDESLAGREDAVIFGAALHEDRLLLTQDLDFSDIRKFKPGTHPGIALIRLRDPNRRRILDRMRQVLELSSIEAWVRCFVVISDKKLRVRTP